MTCKQVQKKLSAFIDNELNQERANLIHEHLKDCPKCAEELEAINSVWDFMETGEQVEPSPYFWTRLSAEITHREREDRLKQNFWRKLLSNPVPLAAAAALIVGLIFGNFVGKALYPTEVYANGNGPEEALALNTFDDLPSGSLGEAYYSLLSENGGEQ